MFGGVLGRSYALPSIVKISQEAQQAQAESEDRGASAPEQSSSHVPVREESLVSIPEPTPATLARITEEQESRQVRDELLMLREELEALRAAPPPAPVVQPMQFIINNSSAVHTEQKTVAAPVQEPQLPVGPDERLLALKKFLASPLNRFALFSVVALALYTLNDHLENKWRMAERQKVIDANFLFRFGRFFGFAANSRGP
jgi:hypothetical protein